MRRGRRCAFGKCRPYAGKAGLHRRLAAGDRRRGRNECATGVVMSLDENSGYVFKNHPQTCDPDDYWGQVKRTVGGQPVSQEQIDLIVAAVKRGLQLGPEDTLLDICCGNGALTTY